jgi:Protein of unknown function (DUF4239)
MGFLFDIPLILSGPALIAFLAGASILGLNWFRENQLPRLRFGESDGDFLVAMVASIMVFYGLAAALTAVHVSEAYEKVREITADEASSLAVLYRNVSEYPEPVRTVLREEIRRYTHHVIHEDWPLQRRGIIPSEGVKVMDKLHSAIMKFEPTTEAQKGLAVETLGSYDRMIEARRRRLDSVEHKLPGAMWLVIVLGAFISLASTFYFPVRDARVHRTQVGLLATLIGLVMFITLALDRPYRGDLGQSATPYAIIYEQLMSP